MFSLVFACFMLFLCDANVTGALSCRAMILNFSCTLSHHLFRLAAFCSRKYSKQEKIIHETLKRFQIQKNAYPSI